jgi:phosphatidate phosphatase APP1
VGKFDFGVLALGHALNPIALSKIQYMVYQKAQEPLTAQWGNIFPVQSRGWTVISDVDDTVRWSSVLDTMALFESTFVQPFRAIPGIAAAYKSLSRKLGANHQFHYLSASPMTLLPSLKTFFKNLELPAGPIHLQAMTGTAGTLFAFTNTIHHKFSVIRDLFTRLPLRKYVMIGDSAQRDPLVYGRMFREMENHGVAAPCIYIYAMRGVNESKEKKLNTAERFRWDFRGIPANRWMVYHNATELEAVDPTRGECYPDGRVNEWVPKGSEYAITKPAKDSYGMAIKFDSHDDNYDESMFRRMIKKLFEIE